MAHSEDIQPDQPYLGALMQATPDPVIAPQVSPQPAMAQEEISAVRDVIQQYSAHPEVSQAFASMVTANAQNPEHLAVLVREMVDQIEQVKANPHVRHPVDPSIAAAVEAIREVELQKPDPLNLLRPDDQKLEAKREADPLTLGSLLAAPIVGFSAKEEPSHVPEVAHPFANLIAPHPDVLAAFSSLNGQAGQRVDVESQRVADIRQPTAGAQTFLS